MALIIGGFGKNTLTGTAGADQIFGLWNNDTSFGGDGNDLLAGGTDSDHIDGGDGFDTASYAAAASAVTVSLATGSGSRGEADGDHIVNVEGVIGSLFSDIITGDGANNHLYGLSGNDALEGGGGNDKLDGGFGADRLTGGAGGDKFVFRPLDGKDRIIDFAVTGGDRIDVSAHGFADFASLMASASQAGGNTVIDFGDGDQVTLAGIAKSSLGAADFVI